MASSIPSSPTAINNLHRVGAVPGLEVNSTFNSKELLKAAGGPYRMHQNVLIDETNSQPRALAIVSGLNDGNSDLGELVGSLGTHGPDLLVFRARTPADFRNIDQPVVYEAEALLNSCSKKQQIRVFRQVYKENPDSFHLETEYQYVYCGLHGIKFSWKARGSSSGVFKRDANGNEVEVTDNTLRYFFKLVEVLEDTSDSMWLCPKCAIAYKPSEAARRGTRGVCVPGIGGATGGTLQSPPSTAPTAGGSKSGGSGAAKKPVAKATTTKPKASPGTSAPKPADSAAAPKRPLTVQEARRKSAPPVATTAATATGGGSSQKKKTTATPAEKHVDKRPKTAGKAAGASQRPSTTPGSTTPQNIRLQNAAATTPAAAVASPPVIFQLTAALDKAVIELKNQLYHVEMVLHCRKRDEDGIQLSRTLRFILAKMNLEPNVFSFPGVTMDNDSAKQFMKETKDEVKVVYDRLQCLEDTDAVLQSGVDETEAVVELMRRVVFNLEPCFG